MRRKEGQDHRGTSRRLADSLGFRQRSMSLRHGTKKVEQEVRSGESSAEYLNRKHAREEALEENQKPSELVDAMEATCIAAK